MERKIFTYVSGPHAADLNDVLSRYGFRRSQSIAYRPMCEGCNACVSVRILVDEFKPSKSLRHIWKRNVDVVGARRTPESTPEQYRLFRDYLDTRHTESGMSNMTWLDYDMMIEDTAIDTMIVEYRMRAGASNFLDAKDDRDDNSLVSVALTDIVDDGLSMVYSFYEPQMRTRSLGTYMILDHIARARRRGLPYVYLGYWVRGASNMKYKERFLPQERFVFNRWERIDR